MLDTEFGEFTTANAGFYPADLREEIDVTIDAIYEPINNGIYRSGFATSQEAYEEAVTEIFDALDRWESVLGERRYLCGDRITEVDCAYSRRSCASTPSTTPTSSVTSGASWATRTFGAT
jgi:putative glutathione S-transferase